MTGKDEPNIDPKYQKGFPVSWEQFHRDSKALAWRLAEKGPFDVVLAIARGGLVPAAVVARELNLRNIETICLMSYDYGVQGEMQVIREPSEELIANRGRGALVVDDLSDTGKTLRLVREMLPEAHVATVYVKPQGADQVDTFVTEVSQDTWIYLPWDLTLQFAPPIREGGG